jgi:nicotinate-nucleotide adenylyltransferase
MKIARLGVMGGSFNPIHHGHLITAERAAEQLRLDHFLFIPTAVSPLKNTSDLAPAEHRLHMVKLAVRGHPIFRESDVEVKRGGTSYTFDTVEALGTDAEIFLIVGDDVIADLPKWYRIHELASRVTFGVVGRPGKFEPPPQGPWKMRRIRVPLMEISGTEIRHRVARKQSIRYLVPDVVDLYIRKHGLYR